MTDAKHIYEPLLAPKPKALIKNLVADCTRHGFGKEAEDAMKLFLAWKKEYPVGFWGQTVAREEKFPRDDTDDAAILSNALGIAKFTFRTDWTTNINSDNIKLIHERFPYLQLEPGIWIHDYKTAGKRERDLHETYQNMPQGFCYSSAYNSIHPDNPCRGVIFHRLVNNKTPVFQHAAVKYTRRSLALTRSLLGNAELLKATDMCLGIAKGCRDYFRSCEYLGQCNQGA